MEQLNLSKVQALPLDLVDTTEVSVAKQRFGWKKGQSGNLNGRPKGVYSTRSGTAASMKRIHRMLPKVIEAMFAAALKGDVGAARLLLDRGLPCPSARSVRVNLRKVVTAQDALDNLNVLLVAVGEGKLTPAEAANIGALSAKFLDVAKIEQFERDLEELKSKNGRA